MPFLPPFHIYRKADKSRDTFVTFRLLFDLYHFHKMSVKEILCDSFVHALRAEPLSSMTPDLEEKLRIFSCECTKDSCFLLLQSITAKDHWKIAIRSLLIYKIKGVCFRHFMRCTPLSRIPSNLADKIMEDKDMSLSDAVEMAFDEGKLISFISSQKELMYANIMKYDNSLKSMQVEIVTRERQLVLDLDQAKNDLEQQKLCTNNFSQLALNLQDALNENYSCKKHVEMTFATTQTEEEEPAVQEKALCDKETDGHIEYELEVHKSLQLMQEEIDGCRVSFMEAQEKAVEGEKALRKLLERKGVEDVERVRQEMQQISNALASESAAALEILEREIAEERCRDVVAASVVEKEFSRKMEVQMKKNANIERDLNRLRAVKTGRDRAEEKVRKDLEKMRVKVIESEERMSAAEQEVVDATAMWTSRLTESEERGQAAVAMFVIMQADYKIMREQGEVNEKLMSIDFKKMEIHNAIQKKLKLDLKRAPCAGLVGTKILAKVQGDAASTVGRCWKAYAVRRGERELRERVVREAQQRMEDRREIERVSREAQERLESDVEREWVLREAQQRMEDRRETERVVREAQQALADEVEGDMVQRERVDDAREGVSDEQQLQLDMRRVQLFTQLANEAVTVRRIVNLDRGDAVSNRLFDILMKMGDPKRMLFATIAWTVRENKIINELPEHVMTDFLMLTRMLEELPGDESEVAWTRMIEVYGAGEEECVRASSPPRLANWPEKRGDFRVIYNTIEESHTQLACAEALVPWLESSIFPLNHLCARLKCSKVLVQGAVRCAQCRHARYCSPECGLADVVHHDAECHLITVRALFRLYRTRGMTSRSIVRMFFGGPPAVEHSVAFNPGCYKSCCIGERVKEIRRASA